MNVGALLPTTTALAASVVHEHKPSSKPLASVLAAQPRSMPHEETSDRAERSQRLRGPDQDIDGPSQSTASVVQVELSRELARPVTTVIDSATQEVIREFPTEEIQRIAANLKSAMGLIFDGEG